MGAKSSRSSTTAEDRQFKRRLNEIEEDLKKLQRAVQTLKKSRRQIGRYRKEAERAKVRENEVQETLDLLDGDLVLVEDPRKREERIDSFGVQGSRYHCRAPGCNSYNVTEIEAGPRLVIVCDDCRARFTVVLDQQQGSPFAKTG